MQYELIIFDLDDTLIDNLENVRYAYKKMIEYMWTYVKFLDTKFCHFLNLPYLNLFQFAY